MKVRSVTVVGGGNGAHALAAVASARSFNVKIWTPFPAEAKALAEGVLENQGLEAVSDDCLFKGIPVAVSCDPAVVIPGSDMVILVLPAFAHKSVLTAMQPHLQAGVVIGAMPARSGFEFVSGTIHNGTVFGVQTLPWACRIIEYGKKVEILGTKNKIAAAAVPAAKTGEVCCSLQEILGVEVQAVDNMLAISLGNVGQIIHPGIMYGLFRHWNELPFPETEIPLFYQGVTAEIAQILEAISTEILAIKYALERAGAVGLEGVLSLQDWLLESYQGSVEDTSTLQRCFNTNKSYRGLKAPVKKVTAIGYVPDFRNRYLTEDIPFGLIVTKAIAQLSATPTPVIDEVLMMTSKWMGKEYLVNGVLKGKDLSETPIPQNYGITQLADLIRSIS